VVDGPRRKLTTTTRIFLSPPRSATALRRNKEGESVRTIAIALLANLAIGVAKLVAGIVTHSAR
jgi:hypothetical protein